LIADRAPRRIVDDGEKQRVGGARLELDVRTKVVETAIRPVEQIIPDALPRRVAIRAFIERLGVLLGGERRQRNPPPLERDPLGPLGGVSVDQGSDGLGRRRCRHILVPR